eukprot:COSAG02_NODE_3794_length_6218_cov_8.112273_1_plen_168_part_00
MRVEFRGGGSYRKIAHTVSQATWVQNSTLRGVKITPIPVVIRKKTQRPRGGQSGALHFSVSFPYSQRTHPPPSPIPIQLTGERGRRVFIPIQLSGEPLPAVSSGCAGDRDGGGEEVGGQPEQPEGDPFGGLHRTRCQPTPPIPSRYPAVTQPLSSRYPDVTQPLWSC